MKRLDLLELTPQALVSLANVGFVKRAQKELAAGASPQLDVADDGTITARFADGVLTRLPAGRSVRDATCNCSAVGMCRHRVMLVLAYQAREGASGDTAGAASSPSPASATDGTWVPSFDDDALATSIGPTALREALVLAASHPVVTVQPGRAADAPPTVQLPMNTVRFFSRTSLVHARCDCARVGTCAHVAVAVWAFRAAVASAPLDAGRTFELTPRGAQAEVSLVDPLLGAEVEAAEAQLDALLLALWLDGSSQPLLALAAKVEALRARLQALGWRWVDDAVDELWQQVQAQHARSSRFSPQRLLAVTAELFARMRAAHSATPSTNATPLPLLPSQILGVGVLGEVALERLRLVSLGAVLWSDAGADGANVVLVDPDTHALLVLERWWPRPEASSAPLPALSERRVAGVPLRQLAAGQVITAHASRRANGSIEIGAGTQTSVLPLSPAAWDALRAPLRQTSVGSLVAHLRDALPAFTRPRHAIHGAATGASGQLHVLALSPMATSDVRWDASAHVLYADVFQPDATHGAPPREQCLRLALPHRTATPGAVDALARALAGEWGPLRAVAGVTWLRHGQAIMEPLALMTARRAVVLPVERSAPLPLPLQQRVEPIPALAAIAEQSRELLAQWLRQGLRHQSTALTHQTQEYGRRLEQAGLTRCARMLRDVHTDFREGHRSALVERLTTLVLLFDTVRQ